MTSSDLSPAERFAASKNRVAHAAAAVVPVAPRLRLDPFQEAACASVEEGSSVLVAAPTGAGKTLVAEFAIHLAMQHPRDKVFYTAPMKALSNQKFQELVAEYGAVRGRPAHRRHQRQLPRPHRRDDDRGAPQHALRGLRPARRPRATSSWTRCTTWPTASAAPCGRK